MAPARRDDLARRLAERLEKSPAKGSAMQAPAADPPSVPTSSGRRPTADPRKRAASGTDKRRAGGASKRSSASSQRSAPALPAERPARGSAGTVRRGHLVADSIHASARRRKVGLRSTRGSRITWDDVMSEGVALLVTGKDRGVAAVDEVRRSDADTARRRMVQATLAGELDRRLVELHLELNDQTGVATTYEHLWTAAIAVWLESTG
jgi:hypothetical protein